MTQGGAHYKPTVAPRVVGHGPGAMLTLLLVKETNSKSTLVANRGSVGSVKIIFREIPYIKVAIIHHKMKL